MSSPRLFIPDRRAVEADGAAICIRSLADSRRVERKLRAALHDLKAREAAHQARLAARGGR